MIKIKQNYTLQLITGSIVCMLTVRRREESDSTVGNMTSDILLLKTVSSLLSATYTADFKWWAESAE